MITNYFKIAWRHLNKNRLCSIINLSGLAIGITGCLLIGLYIWHEWSYDRFHENSDRIARVTWEYRFDGTTEETAMTGTRVGPEFTRKFPEVEKSVRLLKFPRVVSYENQQFEEKNFLYADSTFFKIFTYPLVEGDPHTALDAPESMVITETIARKYFGNENAVGKTLNVGGTKDFIITGIAEDVPNNSQIKFDFVVPFHGLSAAKGEKYSEANYLTFLLLKDPESFIPLQSKIADHMKQVNEEEMKLEGKNYMTFHLQPLTNVHLYSKIDGFEPNSNITYLWVLGAVAFLILLIACVNYTNLSIAQAAGRSSEIGMRKVLGAGRKNIFYQFISEAILMSLVAFAFTMFIAYYLLPKFNRLAGKEIDVQILVDPITILLLFFLSIIVAFLAGAYPAFVLSGGKVIRILKSGFSFTGSAVLRRSLIVFQFVISIFLIISTVVILQQLNYIQKRDLGYNKEQLVILPVDAQIREKYKEIRAAMENIPGVSSVASAYEESTHIGWSDGMTALENNKRISVNALPADEKIVETLGFTIVAGEDFTLSDIKMADPEVHGDNIQYTYMLNEAAVSAFGWTPLEAVGKRVAKGREGIVRAVVKDFHFRSLHEPIGPLIIFMDKRLASSMFVKLENTNVPETLAGLEEIWKQRVPHRPFEYQFLDENYTALYKAEQSIASVFTTFSIIAILLACLGLFALTAYSMAQRAKEIGIRKVLGASVANILTLVSRDFIILVILAVLIAIPLSLLAVNKWLKNFSYHINIEWWVIGLAVLVTLIIATATVWAQAFKTAMANPVENLKSE
ncbi:ABC transporter permease [Salegentibacter sp. JZCK2]|uniref:ABC transporter permease n=1 Tax=Salegentibacter tibetensis TaxID=2873600 RepID=UPI001CC956E9|nr:ABC transporter permease [Salegentibacter tibetensis]MBZ9731145.1 ABC transporter permease [Salegentibacter tibetensis]